MQIMRLRCGPFTVKESVPNDHYTLEKNANYWGEEPITTSITCRVIPEGSARAIALETGEVDLVWNVDPTDCSNIEANSDVKTFIPAVLFHRVSGHECDKRAL